MYTLEEIDAMIAAGKVLCDDCAKRNRCSIYRDYGKKAKGCTGYKKGGRTVSKGNLYDAVMALLGYKPAQVIGDEARQVLADMDAKSTATDWDRLRRQIEATIHEAQEQA